MALIINSPDPKGLLDSIKSAIDDNKVDTWSYDSDGDFTHIPDQWKNTAWLRPIVASGVLMFGLIGKKGTTMKKVTYAVYHGRFSEMLLTHFDDDFSAINATAQKHTSVDIFKGS